MIIQTDQRSDAPSKVGKKRKKVEKNIARHKQHKLQGTFISRQTRPHSFDEFKC